MDYTIIGGEVNLAARLQAHAELGGILIAHETYALVKDVVRTEALAPIVMKGFAQPIRIYRVLGIDGEEEQKPPAMHHRSPGVAIDIDARAMSQEERAAAIRAVEEMLARLKA